MSVKISELPILSSLADNDVIAGVDTSANVTSKIEMATLKNYIDTNTQYTAGTNINITNNVISAPFVYDKTQTNALLDDFKDETNASIEDLKDEKDAQIEELQSEVDSLSTIYNAFPTESGEGESVTLDDTAEVKFKKFDLKGNTSQTTYSGKNLLPEDKYDTTRTVNGITFTNNGNGTFSVSGTSTKDTSIDFLPGGNFNLEANQSYYFYSSQPYNANTFNLSIITVESGATKFLIANSTKTTEVASTSARVTLWIPNGTTVNAQNVKLMLVKGTTAPTTYEPYVGGTASPNPSYPQPVNVVSGDNEINVVGKNLLDKDNYITDSWGPHNGWVLNLEPGTYTLSANVKLRMIKGSEHNSSGWGNVKFGSGNANANTFTFSISENFNQYLWMSYTDSGGNEVSITKNNVSSLNVQLEKGSSATTYEPYQGNTYNIDLPEGIELCKIGNYQDYFYKDSGKWYLHKEIGKVVLNGSESWFAETQRYRVDNIIQGKTFTSFDGNNPLAYCEGFKWGNGTSSNFVNGAFWYTSNGLNLSLQKDENPNATTLANFKTWLGSNNQNIRYVLDTPTNTEITYQPLIDQLNLLEKAMSKDGQTNISQVSNDKPFILDVTAIKSLQNVLDRIELLES